MRFLRCPGDERSQCDLSCSGLPCQHLLHPIQQTIGQGATAAPDNQRRTLAGSS